MDESAKIEARNYLSAAGFFLIGRWAILYLINAISSGSISNLPDGMTYRFGIGLLITAALLNVLKKRDLLAMLFMLHCDNRINLEYFCYSLRKDSDCSSRIV